MMEEEKDMKVILTEEITWKVAKPVNFPCFICTEKEATMRTTVQLEDTIFILCVCGECNKHETIKGFLKGGGG